MRIHMQSLFLDMTFKVVNNMLLTYCGKVHWSMKEILAFRWMASIDSNSILKSKSSWLGMSSNRWFSIFWMVPKCRLFVEWLDRLILKYQLNERFVTIRFDDFFQTYFPNVKKVRKSSSHSDFTSFLKIVRLHFSRLILF